MLRGAGVHRPIPQSLAIAYDVQRTYNSKTKYAHCSICYIYRRMINTDINMTGNAKKGHTDIYGQYSQRSILSADFTENRTV